MKKHLLLCLAVVLLLLFVGCSDEEYDVAGKLYVYEGEGCGGQFKITLNEDGTFQYSEGYLSSHIGMGTWVLEDGILTITDGTEIPRLSDEGVIIGETRFTNRFRVKGDTLVFLAEGSTNFLYIDVRDGEKFHGRMIRHLPSDVDVETAAVQDPAE